MFTIMTYNVGSGMARAQHLVQSIQKANPDILALQELPSWLAKKIVPQLTEIYPTYLTTGEGISGKGVFSKFPILAHEQFSFNRLRYDLKLLLDIQGRSVLLITAHPPPFRFMKSKYHAENESRLKLTSLIKIATLGEPAILVGDLNMDHRQKIYHDFTQAGLIDAYHTAGPGKGYSYPHRVGFIRTHPFMRLDYIWHTHHFQTLHATLGPDGGSDHLPVLAALEWNTQTK